MYVCGDAKRMAKDVELALIDIVAACGARSTDEAIAFVADLNKRRPLPDRCLLSLNAASRGLAAIRDAPTSEPASSEEIGKALRAGANCGSCLPELKRIIADERTAQPV